MSQLTTTPDPPYYAVVFTSIRTADEQVEYDAMADRMLELAAEQSGYLGVEFARDADGIAITVSYWRNRESIQAWREHAEHRIAQELGRSRWYREYRLRICLVEDETRYSRD